ncbi:hypothetical protein GGI22_004183 [Coemansia erecta]|nr:hypothetical protein GGI22_004183 [Coemansia erecta]
MRKSSLIGRPQIRARPQSSSIVRVDIPPAINTSIHTLDALFSQYHSESCNGDMGSESDTDNGSQSDNTSEPQSAHTSASSAPTLFPAHVASETLSDQESSLHSEKEEHSVVMFEQVLDRLFPHPEPESSLYHVYFTVATLDGEPNIPAFYDCSIAMCTARYRRFECLQEHWTTHPWNRRSILLPVAAGGLRRLRFWQHKARFFKSLVQGPHSAENTNCGDEGNTMLSLHLTKMQRMLGKLHRARSSADLGTGSALLTSDYGDIRLFGPTSYFVSPRVLSAEQVPESHASAFLNKTLDSSSAGCVDGRWHTATLIRWGIDPWSSAKAIQMRRVCCQMLLCELGKHWSGDGLIDYAWALENLNYSLSYLPQYANNWRVSDNNGALSSRHTRYRYLCAALIRRISYNPVLTGSLLYQAVHPIEFYNALLFRAPFS